MLIVEEAAVIEELVRLALIGRERVRRAGRQISPELDRLLQELGRTVQNGAGVASRVDRPAGVGDAETSLLSVKEAGEMFGVSASTLARLRRSGSIHAVKVGRQVRFTTGEIDRFIAASHE